MVEYQYGFKAPADREPPNQLEVELAAFLHDPPPEKGGLGKAEHFWKVVSIIWGPHNKIKQFERNPWTERMAAAACEHNYVGLCGSAGSGKTEFAAVWAIVNWMASPLNTLVFCTSTSLKDSNRRIWGRIKAYWEAAPGLPGKLVDSTYTIRTDNGSGVFSDEQGIACIAGEKKNEREAIGKLIGAHPDRLILIVDEMPEITEAILSAALSNMAINPFFQMIGIGNFKGLYDTFGVFVKPKAGYDSISVDDDEWETTYGVCIHFDGMRSPNITGGEDKYECYNSKNLATHKKNYSVNSSEFWRMCRSFPTPIGTENVIYSEADLRAGGAYRTEAVWMETPVAVSGLDPSYTQGGDRAIQWIGKLGTLIDGKRVLKIEKKFKLEDDVTKKDRARDYQIVDQFRANCEANGVSPRYAGLDSTAGGNVLLSIAIMEWSPDVLGIDFSGSASDFVVSLTDNKTGKQLYDRRVSELWYVGKEFIKNGQILGVDDGLAMEMKARTYETIKGADGLKSCVETKKKMKERLKFSPDEADAFFTMLAVCRERLGFVVEHDMSQPGIQAIGKSFEKELEIADDLYANVTYEEQLVEAL